MRQVKTEEKEWEKKKEYSKKVLLSSSHLPHQFNQLQYMKIEKGSRVAPHYHTETSELFYCLEGRAVFEISQEKIEFAPGDALLCESGEIHAVVEVPEDCFFLSFKINQKENDTVWLE